MTSLAKILATVVAVTALVLAGCGGGSEELEGERLPPETTQALLQQLDSVSDRVAANVSGACDDIYDSGDNGNIESIDAALASIPDDVDPGIRSALEQSIDRLKQLVDDECAAISDAESQEETTTPEETAPVEPLPEETDTETTDTETVPDTTAPDEQPDQPAKPENPGKGPDGTGPPGQGGGGIEAPSD